MVLETMIEIASFSVGLTAAAAYGAKTSKSHFEFFKIKPMYQDYKWQIKDGEKRKDVLSELYSKLNDKKEKWFLDNQNRKDITDVGYRSFIDSIAEIIKENYKEK
ncbi:hypothetical protein C0585_06700 [Candidatus Woesearchaeota archaeon]|nr:MAG: hypothetical protein C0585_06700 [Candidatus Woesearchaeota archaeon]